MIPGVLLPVAISALKTEWRAQEEPLRKPDGGEPRRARLLPFIMAWATVCILASVLLLVLIVVLPYNTGTISNLVYLAALSTMQFFVIRRFLQVELHGWIGWAVAGAVALFIAQAFTNHIRLDFLPQQLRFSVAFLLLWGLPASCQWFALRKRFRYHALWLLAALVTGLLGAFFMSALVDSGGLICQALSAGACPYGSNLRWLIFGAMAAELAIPSIVSGQVLFVVVTQGRKSDSIMQDAQ